MVWVRAARVGVGMGEDERVTDRVSVCECVSE